LTASAFRFVLIPELALAAIGVVWALLDSDPAVSYRFQRSDAIAALGLTAGFSALNFGIFFTGRGRDLAPSVYTFLEEEIFPLVRRASLWELLLGAALAGFAEELLFRGLLQPRIGLLAASIVFGVLHGPSRGLWPLALWAGSAGFFLGIIYRATGNLALPTVVHALYDAVALLYVRYRWSPADSSVLRRQGPAAP
jgi:hypothetical protein